MVCSKVTGAQPGTARFRQKTRCQILGSPSHHREAPLTQVSTMPSKNIVNISVTRSAGGLPRKPSTLEGDGFEPSVPRQKDNAFRDSSFPTCARHRRLRKRSPPRPAAASSSCRSRSDEPRTHSPTRRSSGPPDRRHHHPFASITALCFFRVRFISCSCAVALSRGRAPP